MTYPRERKILVPGKKRSRGEIKKKVAKNGWIWLLDARDLPPCKKKKTVGRLRPAPCNPAAALMASIRRRKPATMAADREGRGRRWRCW
jgi:hypothetical protein